MYYHRKNHYVKFQSNQFIRMVKIVNTNLIVTQQVNYVNLQLAFRIQKTNFFQACSCIVDI